MGGGDVRKTARNRIKPTTSSVSGEDHRELRNRKGLRRERGKDQLRILDVNFVLLGFTIVSSLVALFFLYHFVQFSDADDQLPRVITPFPAPKIMDLEMVRLGYSLLIMHRLLTDDWIWLIVCSFKEIIRRAYIGEHIVLKFISVSEQGKLIVSGFLLVANFSLLHLVAESVIASFWCSCSLNI